MTIEEMQKIVDDKAKEVIDTCNRSSIEQLEALLPQKIKVKVSHYGEPITADYHLYLTDKVISYITKNRKLEEDPQLYGFTNSDRRILLTTAIVELVLDGYIK